MASIFCLTNTFLALTDTILQNTRFSIDTMLKCHRRYGIYRKSRSDSVKQTGKRKRTHNKAQTIVIELNAKKEIRVFDEMLSQIPSRERTAFMIEHGYPLIIVETDRSGNIVRRAEHNLENRAELSDYAIEAFARAMLPSMQAYYATPEGKAAYEEWKKKREEQQK